MKCERVAMLLSNPFHNDPRVFKEAKALTAAGYVVTIFAWDREGHYPPKEEREGVKIRRIRVKSPYGRCLYQIPHLFVFSAKLSAMLRREAFEVIHCHDLEMLPTGFLIGRLGRKKVVYDAHEPDYFGKAEWFRAFAMGLAVFLERILTKLADVVIVTNDYQIEKFRAFGVKHLWKVANYPERALMEAARRGQPLDALALGRIGEMETDVYLEEIIEAYGLLRKEFPSLELWLVGRGLQEYVSSLEKKAAEIGGAIHFLPGYDYSELPRYYGKFSVFLMPYHRSLCLQNVTPVKFFEALCFGKPVITTDFGEVGKIVREERCGIILDSVTAEDVAKAVRELLTSGEPRREMGRNGQKAVESKYNWDVSVRQLLEAYRCLSL